MSKDLVSQIDDRARALGLTRSQFLVQLARADLAKGGNLTLTDTPLLNSAKVDAAVEAAVSYISRKARRNRKP